MMRRLLLEVEIAESRMAKTRRANDPPATPGRLNRDRGAAAAFRGHSTTRAGEKDHKKLLRRRFS